MVWQQIYDPFASPVLSTLMAAVPVVVMLVGGLVTLQAYVSPFTAMVVGH
jgi:lactate permease